MIVVHDAFGAVLRSLREARRATRKDFTLAPPAAEAPKAAPAQPPTVASEAPTAPECAPVSPPPSRAPETPPPSARRPSAPVPAPAPAPRPVTAERSDRAIHQATGAWPLRWEAAEEERLAEIRELCEGTGEKYVSPYDAAMQIFHKEDR